MKRNPRGRLVVLSAPSGSGKTTVLQMLQKVEPRAARSISMTTRPPRAGERQGRDYRFVTPAQFSKARRNGQLLEHARILGHWYGTPRRTVENLLRRGKDVLLVIDVQGAEQVRRSGFPAVTIFLMPPSLAALGARLTGRATESPAQIRARLRLARRELKQLKKFDYAVINDRLAEAVGKIRAILKAERRRVSLKKEG